MRHLRLCVTLLFTLMVLPFAAHAQDEQLAWELNVNTYLDVKVNVGLTDKDFDPDNQAYNYPRL